jgi:hypothetical protein
MIPIESIFPTLLGVLCILLGLLSRQLLHWIGLRPLSEVFTTPRFQRSARTTERLGRLFLVLLGIGLLFQGIGPSLLPGGVAYLISIVVLGLSALILIAMIGVTLANRKA